jgi:flagellar motility protein MotE (MotC chaperone)
MIGRLRDFRLVPVLLIAVGCLLALKLIGLVFGGGYTLGQRLAGDGTLVVTTVPLSPATQLRSPASPLAAAPTPSAGTKRSWMQEMFNYPDITGAVDAAKPAAKDAGDKQPAGKESANRDAVAQKQPPAVGQPPETKPADGTVIPLGQPPMVSAAERALLERLHERREQLDARTRELDIRDSLLKAAEKKFESQQAAQKAGDAKGGPGAERKEDSEATRFKAIVTMYESMKPKDAAKIFDRLDIKVLLEVASQINPRQMAEIMAQMTPAAAERLTVELAARSGAIGTDKAASPASLPKIEGRPTGQ